MASGDLLGGLKRPTRIDHLIGLCMAAAYLALLIGNSLDVGVPRDESFYFHAADKAGDWWLGLLDGEVASFSKAEIDKGFEYNHEHPVLMKSLFGLSHHILHDQLGWVQHHITAYRIPTMLMAALALWLAYLLGVMISGRVAGLGAALCLAFMPRVFFHAHLACFDAPVTFTTLLIAFCYLKAARSRRWAIAAGIALGLGLATKLNTFFVPFTLLGVAIIDGWTWKRRHGALRAPDGQRGPLTWYGWIAASMLVLGVAVFFAHWPWLWYDTVDRLRFYVSFHARHVHYPVDYLGHLYFKPPFPVHFPFVFSALTIPVGILLAGLVGLAVTGRSAWRQFRLAPEQGTQQPDRRSAEVFLLACVAVPILVIAMPYTPIFGGTKHWMPAMPFFAILGGIGLERIARGIWPRAEGLGLHLRWAGLTALFITPAAWATLTYGDHGPAYYNALAGGPPGAAEIGMPRNFWGFSSVEVLDVLDEEGEQRALAWWHNATVGAVNAYKRDGLLRKDIRYTGDWTAPYSNWAVYHDHREKLPEELDVWRAYGTDWPVDGYFLDGVQIIGLYRRPAPPAAPPIPPGGR